MRLLIILDGFAQIRFVLQKYFIRSKLSNNKDQLITL